MGLSRRVEKGRVGREKTIGVKGASDGSTRRRHEMKTGGLRIVLMSVGSYPRIGDREEEQLFRRAWSKMEESAISYQEFREVEKRFIKMAMEEQEKAGVQILTDGAIGWYDQISHFARNVEGVEINGLLRFFDTNTYFRQPVVGDNVPSDPAVKPVLLEDFLFATSLTKRIVKPFITGPITLSRLSKGDFRRAVQVYTKLVENEVRILSQNGAKIIQIDEPALTGKDIGGKEFDALPYLERIYEAKKTETKLMYHFYFRDFSRDYRRFQEIPADILGFDMTYSPLEEVIEKVGTKKELFVGIVDGRNTYIEKQKDVIPRLKKVIRRYQFDTLYVGPSCGLEYLPRRFAFLKLKNLATILKNFKT